MPSTANISNATVFFALSSSLMCLDGRVIYGAALRRFEYFGFVLVQFSFKVGVRRETHLLEGVWHNEFLLDMLECDLEEAKRTEPKLADLRILRDV